jgi:hypothetical protein
MRRLAFVLLALLLSSSTLLTTRLPVAAQSDTSALEMSVEAAYSGNVKNGEWLPLWVSLENQGPDVDGELRVRVTSGNGAVNYAVPVPLPTGARKRVPLYVLPNSFSRELEVQLYADGEYVKSAKTNVLPQMNISYMVGILAPEKGALSLISGVQLPGQNRPIVLVDIASGDLPDRPEGLRSFDALVINDLDTSTLSQGQRDALENWVRSGGRLVIGGGPGAEKSFSGLAPALAAVQPDNLVELSELPSLAAYANTDPVRVPGPFLAASGSEAASGSAQINTLASQDGLPLVQELQVGSGVVDFVALDLAGDPFDAWSGTTPFWETLLSPGAMYPTNIPPDVPQRQMIADQMNYALSSLPALDLPSVRGLALMLLLYILVVGPVNYLVLRWRNRLQLAWVTIPVITLVFSAGTFALGFSLRGNDIILNKVALVELQADGTGRSSTFYGLFSPAQRAYEVEVPNSSLLSSLSTYYDPWSGVPGTGSEITFVQSDPGLVRGLSVNQWSMQGFQSEATWTDFGQITSDLVVDRDGIHGTVRNDTQATLKDARLIMGMRFATIGDLAPGETREINLAMPEDNSFQFNNDIGWLLFQDQYSTSITPSRDLDVKRTMVSAIFQNGAGTERSFPISSKLSAGSGSQQPILIGWLDEVPPEIKVNDRAVQEQANALAFQTLPYRLAEGEQAWLPVGMIPGELVEYPQEGGVCGADNSSVWLGRGQAVFAFQVPEIAQNIQPDILRLSLLSDTGGLSLPQTAIYDWQGNSWVELQGVAPGVNLVSGAGKFIDEGGNIRVQLSADVNNGGGCLYVGLGLQGPPQ